MGRTPGLEKFAGGRQSGYGGEANVKCDALPKLSVFASTSCCPAFRRVLIIIPCLSYSCSRGSA